MTYNSWYAIKPHQTLNICLKEKIEFYEEAMNFCRHFDSIIDLWIEQNGVDILSAVYVIVGHC